MQIVDHDGQLGSGRTTLPARWERIDPRFARVDGDERMLRLATGFRWTEGPVYVPAGRFLLWTDIPNDRTYKWDEAADIVTVFSSPAQYANGKTLDRQGRVITCEQGPRRLTRVEHDGSFTVLADRWRGNRLNSPNDVVAAADDSIWFTDPSYGITSNYEGHRAKPEVDGCHLYRIAAGAGECEAVATDFDQPNGLAFSLDERELYVVDSHRNHIRRFDVGPDGSLAGGEAICDSTAGHFDGIRLDEDGRIWAAAGDGVHCFHPDGTLLGKLLVPEIVTNLTFAGLKRNLLVLTAATSVYVIMLNVSGAPPWPANTGSRTDGTAITDPAVTPTSTPL